MVQNNDWKELKIPLSELTLWDENARFPDKYFSQPEKELIAYFCSKKNFKIESFIKEVVKDFDLPQQEKLIVYNDDEQNIVLEGNRRLTTYKLLNNPELAPTDALKKKLIKLREQIDIDDGFSFDCLVTENKTEGYRFIERKHVNGNNEVGWGTQERTHHNVRRGNATKREEFKVAVANIIKGLNIPEQMKEQVLGHGYVTTFWRILDSSVAWEKYGFKLKQDGTLDIGDADFENNLKVIILHVLRKEDFSGEKVDSRSLNTKDKIRQYLDNITTDDFPKVADEIKKNTVPDLFGAQSTDVTPPKKTGGRPTPITKANDQIFGRQLTLKQGKVNDLYRAITKIYDQNGKTDNDLRVILPIIGMSLRLILDVAAREYYQTHNSAQANKDVCYKNFLKLAKKDLKNQQGVNYLSLTNDWISDQTNIEGMLSKYAHGNISVSKNDILHTSQIVADIIEYYYKK